MLLRNREKNPRLMIQLGMFVLFLFYITYKMPHPTTGPGEDLFDMVRGALLGIAIALNLWAAWINGHRRRNRT